MTAIENATDFIAYETVLKNKLRELKRQEKIVKRELAKERAKNQAIRTITEYLPHETLDDFRAFMANVRLIKQQQKSMEE